MDTISKFQIPNDLPAVAERSIEGGTSKSDFEFLMVCLVLTAVIFGLIHAVVYFTGSSNAAGRISAESVMAPKARPPVLP